MTSPGRSARTSALITTSAAAFLVPFSGSSVTIALPLIGREFAAGAVTLGWITTAFTFAAAVLLLPMGRLADLAGRRRVFLGGISGFLAGSVAAAAAPSAGWLIAARVVQGVGGSMMFATNTAILTAIFPAGERGAALGVQTGAVYVGLSLGPVVGGWLVQSAGWRSLFLLLVPICLLLLYLIVTRLPRDRAGSRGEAFDGAGSVLYAAAMFALVYGGTHLAGPRGPAAAWLGAGVAGLAGFVAWEAACAHPVFAVGVLARNRVFLLSNLAAFVNYAATAGSGFLLSLYLQEVKGLSPRGAGTVLLVQPVLQAIVAPLAGRLSDRVEPRFVASCGMVLSALGLLALLRLDAATPLPVILAALGLLGVGFGLFSSPNTNAVMGSVERRDLGVASATVGTMRLTGQLLSMGIVMAALASLLGAAAVTPALAEPFLAATRGCYAVFAALCVAGVFASLARGAVRYSPSRFASSR